jgi:GAF domain-containing protein
MQIAPFCKDETARLSALYQYQILDSEPEVAFDDLTKLAANICSTPIALVSLVDAERQWFKSSVGLSANSTPRDIAFCSYTILQSDILIVPDALLDERFASNPLVINKPSIRFYAGVPLITPDGHTIGTICVVDTVPRELSQTQIESLRALSHQVVAQLELRRKLIESERLTLNLQRSEAILRESEARFRVMADSSPVLIWVDDSNKQAVFCNQTGLQFTGLSLDQIIGKGWQQSLHPDDYQRWLDSYT